MKTFFDGPVSQFLSTWGRRAAVVAIIALLIYQLGDIGWARVLQSLPTEPLFYVIFLVLYFSLPLSEVIIYRTTWSVPIGQSFLAMVKKRVYNKDVLGYSGEAYLYLWAKQSRGIPSAKVWGVIKDNTIVSSVASTGFAVAVLVGLFLTGQIIIAQEFIDYSGTWTAVFVVAAVVLAALGYTFRRKIFWLSATMLGVIFFLHLFRLLFTSGLQVVQWAVVIPEMAWDVWFTLLAVLIVTSRIPFLPARDLAFIGISVEVCRMMGVEPAPVVGMLLVASALDKGMNAVLYAGSSFLAAPPEISGAEEMPPQLDDEAAAAPSQEVAG